MPFDAMVVSAAVVTAFVAFAAVIAWADRQTRPERLNAETSQAKRRSF